MAATVEALKQHKREQAEVWLKKGPAYQDKGLVLCQEDGSPWDLDRFSAERAKTVQRLGFAVRFHDLRHTHATLLLRQGIHPKVVSERLGHSTTGITLDTYSHVLPDMQDEAAEKLDGVLKATAQKLEAGVS